MKQWYATCPSQSNGKGAKGQGGTALTGCCLRVHSCILHRVALTDGVLEAVAKIYNA